MTTATSPIPEALCSDGKISAYGSARSTIKGTPLSPEELRKVDAYWRASLYLCLGMLYLKDNPLLREPLKLEHTKPRLLGHWGSDPGQSFTYTHFNRLINKYDLNAIFISGPGHGAPAVLSQAVPDQKSVVSLRGSWSTGRARLRTFVHRLIGIRLPWIP
jgi:xylulose-5-phosphate/fructose-6-phosphate phosphoketolase